MTAALEGGEWSAARPGCTLLHGKDSVPILLEVGWAPGPVWTGGKSRRHWDSIPDRPARSHSLYRLSYRAHQKNLYSIMEHNGDVVSKKKKNSFKHAAWSKDSILCFWRDTIFCAILRSCADVLRGERADVTDFFLFSWPWWMGSVVKHNMLKNEKWKYRFR